MLSYLASPRLLGNSFSQVQSPNAAYLAGQDSDKLPIASLRIQTTEANKADFPSVSPERAFADYVGCSLILHFFCVNFIN